MIKTRLIQTGVFSLCALLTAGCAREVHNITWRGVVADKESKMPVPHARISATCSYQENIDRTGEKQKYALSDEYGRFNFHFSRGFGFRVSTSASGYLTSLDYKVIKASSLADTIFISSQPFNASLVVRMKSDESFSPGEPFIRQVVKIPLDLDEKKQVEFYGFDFLNGVNTAFLDSADIWVEINQNSRQVVLKTAVAGGIFPVYKQEYSNFLTGVTRAPAKGYRRSHVLTGREAGFFVLCRNGTHLAKMIPQDHLFQLNYLLQNLEVTETGIRFDYLFQPDPANRFSFPVSVSAAPPVAVGFTKPSSIVNSHSLSAPAVQ